LSTLNAESAALSAAPESRGISSSGIDWRAQLRAAVGSASGHWTL
jgi:hypothetical protein